MLIGRRTFVALTGFVALPRLLDALAPSTGAEPPLPVTAPEPLPTRDVALKIDGWSARDQDGAEAWLAVNRSWRVAWR